MNTNYKWNNNNKNEVLGYLIMQQPFYQVIKKKQDDVAQQVEHLSVGQVVPCSSQGIIPYKDKPYIILTNILWMLARLHCR